MNLEQCAFWRIYCQIPECIGSSITYNRPLMHINPSASQVKPGYTLYAIQLSGYSSSSCTYLIRFIIIGLIAILAITATNPLLNTVALWSLNWMPIVANLALASDSSHLPLHLPFLTGRKSRCHSRPETQITSFVCCWRYTLSSCDLCRARRIFHTCSVTKFE